MSQYLDSTTDLLRHIYHSTSYYWPLERDHLMPRGEDNVTVNTFSFWGYIETNTEVLPLINYHKDSRDSYIIHIYVHTECESSPQQ